ncbi:claudin-23 [Eucyclogobius newberryi]|uniref:claudin-23 n=1 Tax=Eucyclogobius newberryi TaxID=166745 RepID=UPI003B58CC2F
MQTPASMVMGIVFAPLGLVLVFTAAITPQWREGQARLAVSSPSLLQSGLRSHGMGVRPRTLEDLLLVRSDGLWESCLQMAPPELKHCWPVSGAYQKDHRVRLVQGLMLTSLFLCGTGIIVSCIGVRCWKDLPLRGVAATGGLLMVLASLLSVSALSVYSHNLSRLGLQDHSSNKHQLRLHPAGSLYFGWLGSCLQMLGGVALMFSIKRPKCPTCPACPELSACTCPKNNHKANMDVYEVSC